MKKSDIVARVATRASLPRFRAESALNAILEAIGDALARGETVTFAGFGTFSTRTRTARRDAIRAPANQSKSPPPPRRRSRPARPFETLSTGGETERPAPPRAVLHAMKGRCDVAGPAPACNAPQHGCDRLRHRQNGTASGLLRWPLLEG